MAKAKDINIYKIFSDTYKKRKMFSFMGFGELKLIPKVTKPIRQTTSKILMGNHVDKFIKERQLTLVVNNAT
mgnify:CR=1 FL=1|jgi:hypothetical protein